MNAQAAIIFKGGARWLVSILVIFIAQFSVFIAAPQPAYALTDAEMQQCVSSFNNKDIIRSELSASEQALLNKCLGDSCTASQSSVINAMRYSCKLAQPSDEFNNAVNTANNNETNGIVKLWCNTAPAGEAAQGLFTKCADDVKAAYSTCKYTGGGVTGNSVDTPEKTAACMKTRLASSSNLINHNIDPAIIAAAVKAGQAATNTATTEAANAEAKKKCTDEGGTWKDGTNGAPGTCTPKAAEEESKTSCKVDGIGWLICPVMRFIAMLNDNLYSFIASMLVVNSSLFDTSSQTYKAWDQFKNVANVLFVIAFLIIVYSQITGAGLNNYGVKKLLPKLIIAAILVNVSYWVCLIGVELSNVIGYGLKQLFDSFGASLESTSSGNSWLEVIGIILAGAGGVAAVIGLALAISFPVLIAGFLALAMVGIVLVLRQAIVVLLVVMAPIAFVAYLLPNTEQWFKRWYKMFFGVLLVFPVVSVVFGASSLAATVLNSAGDWKMQLVALGASALPLYLVPGLLKGSMAATGSLGAKLSNVTGNRIGNVGKQVGDSSLLGKYAAQHANLRKRNINQTLGGQYEGRNPFSRAASKVSGRINNSRFTGDIGNRVSQDASQVAKGIRSEEVKAAHARIEDLNLSETDITALATGQSAGGMKADEAARLAAQQAVVDSGDSGNINKLIDHAAKNLSADKASDARELNNIADSLQRSSNKPGYVQPGDLVNMRQNRKTTTDSSGVSSQKQTIGDSTSMIQTAINNNVYSPGRMASTGRQEMGEISRVAQQMASSGDAAQQASVQKLSLNAQQALNDPRLSVNVGKQSKQVETIANLGSQAESSSSSSSQLNISHGSSPSSNSSSVPGYSKPTNTSSGNVGKQP